MLLPIVTLSFVTTDRIEPRRPPDRIAGYCAHGNGYAEWNHLIFLRGSPVPASPTALNQLSYRSVSLAGNETDDHGFGFDCAS